MEIIDKKVILNGSQKDENKNKVRIKERNNTIFSYILTGESELSEESFITDVKNISSGEYFVKKFDDFLKKTVDCNTKLTNILNVGLTYNTNTINLSKKIEELLNIEKPVIYCSIVKINKNNNSMELFSIGHNRILLEYSNENNETNFKNIIDNDYKVKEDKKHALKIRQLMNQKDITYEEGKNRIKDDLIETRKMLNKKFKNYRGLTLGENEIIKNATYKKYNLDNIKNLKILIINKGFYSIISSFNNIHNYKELLNKIKQNNINELVSRIRNFEQYDYKCKKYPRLSKSQNIGVTYLKINLNK